MRRVHGHVKYGGWRTAGSLKSCSSVPSTMARHFEVGQELERRPEERVQTMLTRHVEVQDAFDAKVVRMAEYRLRTSV